MGFIVLLADSYQRLEDSKVDLAASSRGIKELLQLSLLARERNHPKPSKTVQELWPSNQHAATLSRRWWGDSEDPIQTPVVATHPTSEVFENVEGPVTWIVKPCCGRAGRKHRTELRVGYLPIPVLVHDLVDLLNVASPQILSTNCVETTQQIIKTQIIRPIPVKLLEGLEDASACLKDVVLDSYVDPLDESIGALSGALLLPHRLTIPVLVVCVLLLKKSSLQLSQVDQTSPMASSTSRCWIVQKGRCNLHRLGSAEPNAPPGEEVQQFSKLHDKYTPIGVGARQGAAQVKHRVLRHELSNPPEESLNFRRLNRASGRHPSLARSVAVVVSAIIPESVLVVRIRAIPAMARRRGAKPSALMSIVSTVSPVTISSALSVTIPRPVSAAVVGRRTASIVVAI